MKFKELEKLVNKEGVILTDYSDQEVEKATLDRLLSCVCKKIRSILKDHDIEGVRLTTYNQRIYLDSEKYHTYYRNEPSGIIIKVRKETAGSSYNYFGNTTYYKFRSIEIEDVERYIDKELKKIESIEEYFEYEEKMDLEHKEYVQNKKDEFISKVKDMKEFFELMKEYKNLNYDTKKEIAKNAFGEDYWKYL